MGLDNGLIIKPKTEKGSLFMEEYFSQNLNKYSSDIEYKFGYWRKCWNIRERVFDIFLNKITSHNDCAVNNMTFNDLEIFKDNVLAYFLDEDNWEYHRECSQIFSWIEELPSIANSMRDIYFFLNEVKSSDEEITEEDFDIYFYDSY